MWACTVTGSPKPAAMQTIENMENSPRGWYSGCIGFLWFNGFVSTGMTLRTVHLKKGKASVRAGATLLYDSEPSTEEKETQIKAPVFPGCNTGQKTLSRFPQNFIYHNQVKKKQFCLLIIMTALYTSWLVMCGKLGQMYLHSVPDSPTGCLTKLLLIYSLSPLGRDIQKNKMYQGL
ncbi:MAG: hypothetical protein Ct9H300mP28_36230 [Pseudomonadota bacterium]|nr:MAG: hypothetical protein Ct9H300mP28_36230 [Pseudomonadota bacterium]